MTAEDTAAASAAASPTSAKDMPAAALPAVVTAAVPAAATTAAVVPGTGDDPTDPQWLPKRLERERGKLLKSLGFASEEEARVAGEAAKAVGEAKKSAEQRAIEAGQRADSEKAAKDRALGVVTEHAARMMIGLTPEQKAAVTAVAGDDPVSQLNAIGALTPTWAAAAKAVTDAAKAAADASTAASAAVAAASATTAPAAGAPSGGTPPPQDKRAAYESVRSSNPFEAAAFGAQHPDVYNPKR